MSRRNLIAAFLLMLGIVAKGAFAGTESKTYSLGDAGTLHVALPAGWTGESDEQTPPTISLKAPADKHVSIQITALPVEMTEEKVKVAASIIGQRYAEGSTEKKVTLEAIKGDGVDGYVSSYTDASADPGEFKFVTAGVLICNKRPLAVTLLYNAKTSDDHTSALAALKSLSLASDAAAPAAKAAKDLHVKSPDGTWSMVVPGNWQVADDSKSADGKSRQITAMGDEGKLMLTLFLEPADKPTGDAKAARDFYLARMKQNPLGMEHLKEDAVGHVATLEYDQGTRDFMQHNLNAYLSHAGVWVDVHVSKSDFDEKADRKSFDDLVKGLKVE